MIGDGNFISQVRSSFRSCPIARAFRLRLRGESHALDRSLGGTAYHTIMPYLSDETCFILRFV